MKNPLLVTREELVTDPRFTSVTVLPGPRDVQKAIAREVADILKANNARGKGSTMIWPVSPLDYSLVADICNAENISCRDLVIINMDEFLDGNGEMIPPAHSLSFAGYMDDTFYNRLRPELSMPRENRIIPDVRKLDEPLRVIGERGGVDIAFVGIGISGHIAFNEPCSVTELNGREFDELTTRIVALTEASRAQIALSTGGNLWDVPRFAVTLGMKELLSANCLHVMGIRTWQPALLRRAFYGPVTPHMPASYMQKHANLKMTLIEQCAELPELRPA
jgi:glucosamine-6-phosphate deaminase